MDHLLDIFIQTHRSLELVFFTHFFHFLLEIAGSKTPHLGVQFSIPKTRPLAKSEKPRTLVRG